MWVLCSVLGAGCGLQARPRAPVVAAEVYALRTEVREGALVLTWRGKPAAHTTTYQVQRRERRATDDAEPPFGALLVNITWVAEDPRDAPRFEVIGTVPAVPGGYYEIADDNLTANRRYTYRVHTLPNRGRDDATYRGPEIGASWDTPPPPPESVTVIPVDGGVRLEWQAVPGATGYRVYRKLSEDTSTRAHFSVVEMTKFTDLGPGAQEARYIVRSVRERAAGSPRELEGKSSPVATLEDIAVLAPPPTELRAVQGDGGVSLSWRRPESTTPLRFRVYRQTGDEWTALSELIASTAYDDAEAPAGVRYRVVSVDALGREGPPSETVRPR